MFLCTDDTNEMRLKRVDWNVQIFLILECELCTKQNGTPMNSKCGKPNLPFGKRVSRAFKILLSDDLVWMRVVMTQPSTVSSIKICVGIWMCSCIWMRVLRAGCGQMNESRLERMRNDCVGTLVRCAIQVYFILNNVIKLTSKWFLDLYVNNIPDRKIASIAGVFITA